MSVNCVGIKTKMMEAENFGMATRSVKLKKKGKTKS